ncbi:Indigoidine synthase A-like protein [Mycena kentingensis (nom. inval.)]|nr:Indigoidine synthase A-like protein [Mycena kentingensis (nom. inval.)]
MPLLQRVAGSVRFASRLAAARERGAPIDVLPEVEHALASRQPVVALETALTTHGLPPPTNLQVTRELEAIVRSTGCVPATIGVVEGRVKIGLNSADLERLADVKRSPRSVKISRRDIAPALATKADGGTTICATLIFAALAGIKVFATGGLGGVHRGGENSLDISADLHELARCPVGLVSAGVKSILDVGRTLEYLETLGVPVVPYGPTKDFPAFFSPRSGFYTPWNVDNPRTAAEMLLHQAQLGLENGALIAAPIPEEYTARGQVIQEAVDQAVRESESNGMSKRGKDVTPWLLSRVAELSKGSSIELNIALLRNSAQIGGQIALEYQQLLSTATDMSESKSSLCVPHLEPFSSAPKQRSAPPKVMVIGSAAIDVTARATSGDTLGSTSPGSVTFGLGGVARNVAESCFRVGGQSPILVLGIGNDAWGSLLRNQTTALGMSTDGFIQQETERTAVCNLVLDAEGALVGGVADMDITQNLDPSLIVQKLELHRPALVAVDGNLSPESIQTVVEHCGTNDIPEMEGLNPGASEPTSVVKSTRIIPAIKHSIADSPNAPVAFFTPNIAELRRVYDEATQDGGQTWIVWRRIPIRSGEGSGTLDFLLAEGVAQMAIQLTPFFSHILVKCGDKGLLVVLRLTGVNAQDWLTVRSNQERRLAVAHGNEEVLVVQHFAPHSVEVISSTGAGDSLVGALLASLVGDKSPLRDSESLRRLVGKCQQAAALTLQSHQAVSPLLNMLAE